MPAPELQADARRTRIGRVKMLLVLLVVRRTGGGLVLQLLRAAPAGAQQLRQPDPADAQPAGRLPLYTLDGEAVDAKSLHGQWLLLALGAADCDGECQQRLYMQRQLREMVGRERERIDKIWLVTDGAELPATLRTALQADPALRVLRVPRAALAAWLQPEEGHALEQHLYLVDPMGEWMMRMPADPDPARVKRDLERLLRASSSWDLPGR